MLAVSTLDAFSQTGIHTALIQKKEDIRGHLDVAWTVLMIRGAVLFTVLFIGAPIVAKFFDSPQAGPVLMVISINMLLTGAGNIGIVFFQKELEFKKQFIYELSATLVDLVVSISLAFILMNVWALVWGGITKNVVRFFLSYVIHPYRPRIRFDKEKIKELFGFGIWVFGSTILVFLITQGDDIFVGKMLGVAALAFYQMAYLVSNLPVTEITDVISRVTFPAYSKLQSDLSKLGDAYFKVLKLTSFFTIPVACGILILGSEFIQILLGEKWAPAIPVIRILALAGMASSIAATARPVLHGIGKPRADTTWQIVRLIALVVMIFPLSKYGGITGTAVAVLISTGIWSIGFTILAVSMTGHHIRDIAKILLIPSANSVLMMLILQSTKSVSSVTSIWGLLFLISAGFVSYSILTYVSEKLLNHGILKMLKELSTSLTNHGIL